MLGRKVPHPKSTKFDSDNATSPRAAKRLRRLDPEGDAKPVGISPRKDRREIPDSEEEDGESDDTLRESEPFHKTDLESALPLIKTDHEAIQEYEAYRAAQETGGPEATDVGGRLSARKWIPGKSSIYVDAFNLALDTVLDEESHLFDEAEMALFDCWKNLSYEAQYLYVRLFLRKTAAWHRINALGYHGDIADLNAAIQSLQEVRNLPASTADEQHNPGELEPPGGSTLGSIFTFGDSSDEHITTLEEASTLLKLDELKSLAKDVKVQGKNKSELLKNFRRTSGRQTGLGFPSLQRTDTDASIQSTTSSVQDEGGTVTPIESDAPGSNRDTHFLRRIMNETGPCIRLSTAPYKLFERVHLVFYRSSEWTEKSLTTIILARIARRNFPDYIVSRSASIFESRSLLVEFEASIRTQFRVDSILEFNGTPTKEGFQIILDVFEDVYPRWRALLAIELNKENSVYLSGEGSYLRRLSPAWVYTRIVHKAAYILGRLHQHKREHGLLCELLDQRLFHASRRGDWYQRKALLEEHYMHELSPPEGRTSEANRKHWRKTALQTCEVGLEDPLVHVMHHYDLQKRVMKLEKALKISMRLKHDFGHVRLAKPVEVTVYGVRIEREGPPRPQSRNSNPFRRNSSPGLNITRRGAKTIWLDPAIANDTTSDTNHTTTEDNDKSDNDANHVNDDDRPLNTTKPYPTPHNRLAECSVEAMCLTNYRQQGWKGYHAESSLLRTLFAYLFYDILFLYLPNVFQTPYQTCPLDLHTDAFYPSRRSEINARLADISNGEAAVIVRRVWIEQEERRTCVVGLDWAFDITDLEEIVGCWEGGALAVVCKVLCQEYAQRGGGVPDLFLWRPETKEVKFAEVKSENDRLSDTQRLWIHVLTGAGVGVELCNAVAKEVRVVQ